MGRDRASRKVRVLVLAILVAPVAQAEPAWGSPANSLAIGIDVGLSFGNERRLRVHFRNQGALPLEFAVGGYSGRGSIYHIDLVSTSPDGGICKLLDTTVGAVAGYISPVVRRLMPGDADYVTFDLKKLICMAGSSTNTLDFLLARGHSVRAIFANTADNNAWAKVPGGWTGTAISGSFHREPAKRPTE